MPLPQHVAIIMDGNRRWAAKHGLPHTVGHQHGAEAAKRIIEYAIQAPLRILTLFAFSQENWGRPKIEVGYLMDQLFHQLFSSELLQLKTANVAVRIIGDQTGLSKKIQTSIQQLQNATKDNTGLQLVIALNYSGQWDITQASRQVAAAVLRQEYAVAAIDSSCFSSYLCLADLPPPDLLIRTSGEQRLSNFLLWQLAYTELYFTEQLWPDFTVVDLQAAFTNYQQRIRRFGQC